MKYAKIENGQVAAYPYTYRQLVNEDLHRFLPSTPGDWMERYGVFVVHDTPRPAPSSIAVNVVEDTPVFSGGQWTQSWVEVPATAEQIAERQSKADLASEMDAAKLDAWIVAYLAMTPEGAEQYVLNNVTNLATARDVMSKLAYAVRVLIRREFRR